MDERELTKRIYRSKIDARKVRGQPHNVTLVQKRPSGKREAER